MKKPKRPQYMKPVSMDVADQVAMNYANAYVLLWYHVKYAA